MRPALTSMSSGKILKVSGLAQTGMKLDEIAEKSGYQNANSFWVAFRQTTGLSPKQYQAKFYV